MKPLLKCQSMFVVLEELDGKTNYYKVIKNYSQHTMIPIDEDVYKDLYQQCREITLNRITHPPKSSFPIKRAKLSGIFPGKVSCHTVPVKKNQVQMLEFIPEEMYILNRCKAGGRVIGPYDGETDIWLIQHDMGRIAVYYRTEVFDRYRAKQSDKK